MSSGNLLGLLILTRHGDRRGFYQSESSYTPSQTSITPLGTQQMYSLGSLIRSTYVNASSPDIISGISLDLANRTQLSVRADAGGEGGVIWNSALSLLNGLYPPSSSYTETLSNGTRVTGFMDGYQSVPIESVEPTNDVSLEGWTSCGAFNKATEAFYASDTFKEKASQNAEFLNELPQYLDGRNVTLENIWNVFDFMNVQSIHDETFLKVLPSGYLEKARDLANWHEYHIFSSVDKEAISNVAIRTMVPSIMASLDQISSLEGTKIVYNAVSYKPFISLFRMLGTPSLSGIVNYAAAVVFEVRSSPQGPTIQMKFKNGTDDSEFHIYSILNSTSDDMTVETFRNALSPYAINTTREWCSACGNTKDRGCAAFTQVPMYSIAPVGAGFLGAGLTIVAMLSMFAVLVFLGILTIGKKTPEIQPQFKENYRVNDNWRKVLIVPWCKQC